ncbi:MAG: AmmeMemoRadiSam system radical SAM enzyme [Candidatus Helarchaeota archaeon]
MPSANSLVDTKCIKTALLKTTENGKIRCRTCEQKCLLDESQIGLCKTRKVIEGDLKTLIYGNISSISNNPIEKKPFYHFFPGTFALTIGSWGCNFACPWCQNYHISKTSPNSHPCTYMSPERLIQRAIQLKSRGLSYSFNEPTLMLEHALDTFPKARQKRLYNTFVTNGYMTLKALDLLISSGLDAMNVDIKGDENAVRKFCRADVNKIYRNCAHAIKNDVHVEITTLIIPGVNDEESLLKKIASRIKTELGPNTPWHLSRYYPQYEFSTPPTPLSSLKRARKIGHDEGLNYVYLGNVSGHEEENTYCHNCKALLIERHGYSVRITGLKEKNKCKKCGEEIPIIL